jgi:hypothetical protein
MTTKHDCKTHANEARSTAEKPYRFLDSGLSNVYLVGVRYWTCKECGRAAAEIPALEQLMTVIAKAIVMKPALLNGEEIRFLRKRVGKKAADFSELISNTPQHFSKLENDQLPLGDDTDKLIRLTYGMLSGDQQLLSSIMANIEEWLRSISGKQNLDITFKKKAGNWTSIERKAA